jgi:endoglucanase
VSGNDCPESGRRAFLTAVAASGLHVAGCLGDDDSSPTADTPTDGPPPGSTASTDSDVPTDSPASTDPLPDERGTSVLVDQVGYSPGEVVRGVVSAEASTFTVRDAGSGEVVANGVLSDPIDAGTAGETVRHAVVEIPDPGEYVLAVDTGAASVPFTVGDGVGGTVLAQAVRGFTLRRAGTAIADPVTGLERDAGHRGDREAELYFSDPFHEAGETIDVRGGWYDAGDYGKYVPPAAVTVAQLLLAYEWNPAVFEEGSFAIHDATATGERDDGMPAFLAEVAFELEWLERMQRPDGAVYHKVAGRTFPALDTPPVEDTQPRYVFGLSTFGTAMCAGAMAMAARMYEPHAPGFAGRMLENAEDAFAYLETTPEPAFRYDEGQDDGSGPYRKETDREERFWAGAELLKTTGDDRYEEYLAGSHGGRFGAEPSPISWADAGLLGRWAYYTAEAGAADRVDAIADALCSRADAIRDRVEADGYRIALTAEEYYWGSAKRALAKATLLWMADAADPDPGYRRAARDQVHYVLGRSPTGYAYVTGAGERSPENVHDRITLSTGTAIPGRLVGGPNADGDDPVMAAYIDGEDPPPAKAYLDDREAYSVNEPAIDYAAPLVFALATLVPPAAVSPA